ncbi:MAG: nucleotidyltransferase domain-containing protein [bacterium]|nr:nucleotidyltransferase domain-containing protein [bacterium]MDZ4285173.1 nucleotidyltransferase domain-containing protein [Patescibacteria group bacterium]
MHTINQKIKEITDTIVKEYQPEKIILFGSYAWGEPHEWSDVDLLVVKESTKTQLERRRELRRLLLDADMPLDILVHTKKELEDNINEKRNLFLEDIVRNGLTLYSATQGEIELTHTPATLIT